MTTDTTETTNPSGAGDHDDAGEFMVGFSPSQKARAEALAELGKAPAEGDEGEPQGEPADGQGDDDGGDDGAKGKRREVDAKKLEEDEKARKARELEQPTTAAFKKMRREKRDLEQQQANVESGKRQLEQMQTHLKEKLDKAEAYDALETELKASPVKVLKRYGIDLSDLNTAFFKENDPQGEVKTLAQELADVKKQLAERDEKAQQAQQAEAFEAEVSSAVGRMSDYIKDTADEDPKACPAANFFREVDPKHFEGILREATLMNAQKNGGTVIGDEVIKMVDQYYQERYVAIQARYAGSARTSNGTVTPAKLDKAPQALSRAASAPVGSKDPESYEERWKAALSEL